MKKILKSLIVKILVKEAKVILKKYKPKIAVITGSVGKTSAKDAIYTVLSATYSTRKSEKSFNSEIGLPLTILGCQNAWSNLFLWIKNIFDGLLLIIMTPKTKYPEWLVLEVGADKPGDILSVSEWLKPDVAVITRFGDIPVHVEFFRSVDELVKEKGYLAKELKPAGIFIYNADDKRISLFAESVDRRKISYGFLSGAEVVGSDESFIYGKYDDSNLEFPVGISCKITHNNKSILVSLMATLGRHQMYPLLAAYTVGISQNINPEIINEALKSYSSPKGRMKLMSGIKDTLIIDDSYNSSPVAVQEALRALSDAECKGRRIAILGDMLELGHYSIEEHKKVGEVAAKCVNILVTVGVRSRATAEAALDAKMADENILQFDTAQEAGKYLESVIAAGDIILIKGSQSMRMERAVEEIMRYPEQKEKLLVRQDPEWLAKK